MGVNPEDYDDIVGRLNRKYGDDLRKGDDMESVESISTGSLELDIAMGGKGIPRGRWTRFYGGYSSTKTLSSYKIAANAQAMGLSVAYYNIEKQYHPEFVAERGVDTSKLTVVEGATIEEIGEKMEALLGVVNVHIIDSCSAAVSEDELNADIRDWRPGISSRAWGKVFRRLNERFSHVDNTAVLIDQVRTNFQTGGDVAAGGKVFDHQSSMSVMFKKGKWLWKNSDGLLDENAKQKNGSSGQMEPEGAEIKVRVEKSRVCRPFRTATLRLDYDNLEFDREFELAKAAKYYGVVNITSKGRYEYKGEKAHGEWQLRKIIRDNPELQKEINEVARLAAAR